MHPLITLLDLAKENGPLLVMFGFFIWRDYNREKIMTKRIEKVEDFQRNELQKIAINATLAIEENTKVTTEICAALRRRPCVASDMAEVNLDGSKF